MHKFFFLAVMMLYSISLGSCARNDISGKTEIFDDHIKKENQMEENVIKITVGETVFTVKPENNSSVKALIEHLKTGEVKIDMNDYANMEKVGELPFTLPQNNSQLHTIPGDVILYLGKYFVIYYGNNDYSLTKLGVIEGGYSGSELKKILGNGDVSIKISL